jgi:hypothetical protein
MMYKNNELRLGFGCGIVKFLATPEFSPVRIDMSMQSSRRVRLPGALDDARATALASRIPLIPALNKN